MHFTHRDSLKFLAYSSFFVCVLFGYNMVSSPYFETTFDSASIDNKEIPASTAVTEIVPENKSQSKETTIEEEVKNPIAIAFNPLHVQIDSTILDRINDIVASSFFKPKVIPLNLLLDTERKEPRGQVLGNKLILAMSVSDESEQSKVLVHELGHIVDIFYLKKGIFSDPSDIFYAISWESFQTKKKGQRITDFVSGYALSNKYEDFAESFAFYIFHNEDFARLAKDNPVLRGKYDFFHSHIFENDEFVGTSFEKEPLKRYNWDVTKIGVDTKKYLYYIR